MITFRNPVAGLSEQSLSRFLARARRAARLRGQVSVLVTSSRELRTLNRRFLGKDEATDVLSFPAVDCPAGGFAGDIAISAEIARRTALQRRHPAATELKILVLHGVLHLAGYDHESDQGEMERREARLRKKLRLPDSLIRRTLRSRAARKRAIG